MRPCWPEQLRETVLGMGTLLLGRTANHRTAAELAERYFPYTSDYPYKVVRVHGVVADAVPGTFAQPAQPAQHGVVDSRTEDVSREGQIALHSRQFLTLPRFHFLLGRSDREGSLPTALEPVSIEEIDEGQYPDKPTLAKLRAQLMERDGVHEEGLLAEINGRISNMPPERVPYLPGQDEAPHASRQPAARGQPPGATPATTMQPTSVPDPPPATRTIARRSPRR